MQEMQIWKPKITRRSHPSGEAGIRVSLDEVAKRAREGFDHPDVRAWAGRKLRDAGDPKGPINRAAALLLAQRAQNIWVPDPEGVEYMVGAHVTLGDENGPKMVGGDCDDNVIAYLAACESVGIRTAVVGAAYDEGGNITHVLGMVTDGNGKWYYADPSTDFPFGEAKVATREDVIDTRTGKHICVADACSIPLGGQKPPDVGPGRFVGVDGIPGVLNGLGDDAGAISTVPTAADYDSLRALSNRIGESWNTLVSVYTDMRDVSQILGAPAPGSPENKVWTATAEQTTRNAEAMVGILRMALEQAASGARQVAYIKRDSGPMAGVVDLGIERLAGDPYYVGFDADMKPQIFLSSDNSPVNASGQISGWPLAVGLGLIGSAIVAWVVTAVLENQTKQAQIAADAQVNERRYDLIKGGNATPDQLAALELAKGKVIEAQAKTQPKSAGEQIGTAAKDTADSISTIVTAVVGGAAVLGIGYVAFQAYQKANRR